MNNKPYKSDLALFLRQSFAYNAFAVAPYFVSNETIMAVQDEQMRVLNAEKNMRIIGENRVQAAMPIDLEFLHKPLFDWSMQLDRWTYELDDWNFKNIDISP